MEPGKVRFTEERETSLLTLYGRAVENRLPHPVLADPWAERVVAGLDYDAARLDFPHMKVPLWRARLLGARGKLLDLWTSAFLARHPQATVLQLGCGLDSRAFRLELPAGVRWFDVDYPDVIELRQRFYPARPGYATIGSALAETAWLEQIPADRQVFVVAEGVTQYLDEATVGALLNGIAARFPEGQAAFDVHSRALVRRAAAHNWSVQGTGATFGWGIDDPREVERLAPAFQLVERVSLPQLAHRFGLPLKLRAILRLSALIPSMRAITCLLYRFPQVASQ